MKSYNLWIGRWGEQAAADHLIQSGYTILARNERTPFGEIDIIAHHNEITTFFEVKTRTSSKLGFPEESVTPKKQAHMTAAAEYYASEHGIDHWQIDILAVEGKPGKDPVLTHFENVNV
jgi:putative endonuclease